MKKRFLSALLCMVLLVALLPATALAVPITEDYTMDFTATTAQSWASNKSPATEDCSGTGWSWAYDTKTLTLSGLDFTTAAATVMKLPADTTLVLQNGTVSTVTSNSDGAGQSSCGIYANAR